MKYQIKLNLVKVILDFSITDDFFCGQPMTLINFDEDTPKFIKLNDGHSYWKLIPMNDSNNNVVVIGSNNAKEYSVYNEIYIRPVINVKKNVLEGVCSLKSVHLACYFGDSVTYNSSEYYVIDDSDTEQKYVTLLKKEPLTADEVNQYSDSYRSQDGEYPFCLEDRECISDDFGYYNYSDLRKIVDQWASSYHSNLVGIDDYKARLLQKDELFDKFGYTFQGYPFGFSYPHSGYLITLNTPNWVYNIDKYWSMVDYYNGNDVVYSVSEELNYENLNNKLLVRPVINLNKKAIENGCHVGNNTNYTTYSIGETISYNNESYCVISNSSNKSDYVTLIKQEPLSYDELVTYNNGYELGRDSVDNNSGIISYYKSDSCYYNSDSDKNTAGCSNDYNNSFIKNILNNWSNSFNNDLEEENGYKVRLITNSELHNMGHVYTLINSSAPSFTKSEYNCLYSDVDYWTMSTSSDSNNSMDIVSKIDGNNGPESINKQYAVRPVINLKKCAIDGDC